VRGEVGGAFPGIVNPVLLIMYLRTLTHATAGSLRVKIPMQGETSAELYNAARNDFPEVRSRRSPSSWQLCHCAPPYFERLTCIYSS